MNRIQEVQKLYPKFAIKAQNLAHPDHKNKYLKWIANQLANKHTPEDIRATVNAFHRDAKRLKSADIYSYKDLKELEDELKNLEMSNRKSEAAYKEAGSVKIYSDDICTLVRINSKFAMLYYGRSSRWCISMESKDYWEEYSSEGNIFYVLIDKSTNNKYAIQKKGLLEITVWLENDEEMDVNEWLLKNPKFDKAIFACLHDREDPMLFKIKKRQITRKEFSNWIENQHNTTITFLKNRARAAFNYYSLDINKLLSNDIISELNGFSGNDLQELKKFHPEYIDNVIGFLVANPKLKCRALKNELAKLIPNPEILLSEAEADLIKMKTDPFIAIKLLKSPDKKIWEKALKKANPKDVLSILPSLEESKQKIFIKYLKYCLNCAEVIKWLAQSSEYALLRHTDNIWSKNKPAEYMYNNEDDDDDDSGWRD